MSRALLLVGVRRVGVTSKERTHRDNFNLKIGLKSKSAKSSCSEHFHTFSSQRKNVKIYVFIRATSGNLPVYLRKSSQLK